MLPCILLFTLCCSFEQVTVLAGSTSSITGDFAVSAEGDVVFISGDGTLVRVDPYDPQSAREMQVQWTGQLEGWENVGSVFSLCGSPDGTLICYTVRAFVPGSFLVDGNEHIPAPLLVVCCGPDGSEPRLLGLAQDAGGGPYFGFTMDSRHVYGSWASCSPSPESYVRYIRSETGPAAEPWLMVDVVTGSRCGNRAVLEDGFVANSVSDHVATGGDPPNRIVNVMSGETVLARTGTCSDAIIDVWVLPDAGLAGSRPGAQVLRRIDGTETINPGDPYEVYCLLPDGGCVFSQDRGRTVSVGQIDWDDFSCVPTHQITALSGMLDRWVIMKPLPEREPGGGVPGLVFMRSETLYFIELPPAD